MRNPRSFLLVLIILLGFGIWFWLTWLEHQTHEQPFTMIEDGLYLGSAVAEPPPGTRAVVNLCGKKDPYSVEKCLWEPIFEGTDKPTIAWLKRSVEFIDAQRRDGLTTFVHCLAGMNRSGAVVTAYLMFEHGWSRDEALARIQAKRPQVQPNLELMRLLADWEREVLGGK